MKPEEFPPQPVPKPPWIRVRIPSGKNFQKVRDLVHQKNLHTVCAEALCPNLGECWGRGTATFLILGDICTRNCRFCGVKSGSPSAVTPQEAEELADAVSIMALKHAVITSVTRDDLPDGGAGQFARSIQAVRQKVPGCTVEVLVPDFKGSNDAIRTVVDAGPDIFAHNMETVPRLYPKVRPQAGYEQSLRVIKTAKNLSSTIKTKSGIMVGLGESREEILEVMADLRKSDCDILTVGQYLSPTRSHIPVVRYYTPQEFLELKEMALGMGFKWVESGPLVRSSYHADEMVGVRSW
jgi:lipoic acid synthetase